VPQFAHLLIGHILMDRHELSADGIDSGLRQQDQEERERGQTRFLGEILVERKLATHEQVAEALSFQRDQFAQSLVGPYRLESLLMVVPARSTARRVLVARRTVRRSR